MVAKYALAAAATVASLAGAANASAAARANAASVRSQVENERKQAEIVAAQQEQDRARKLGNLRSSQISLMAARGIDLNSWDAQMADDKAQYDRDIANIGINRMSRSYQLALQGYDAEQQAMYQSRGAWMSAVGNIAGAWMRVPGSTPPDKPDAPKPGGVSRSAYMAGYTGAG